MDYWLNEAPMADPSRQNAICFALGKLLREGAEIQIREERHGRHMEAVVNESIAIALPEELAVWWRKVLSGHRATPITATLEIPLDLLNATLRSSLLEQERRTLRAWAQERPRANAA